MLPKMVQVHLQVKLDIRGLDGFVHGYLVLCYTNYPGFNPNVFFTFEV